MSLSEYNNQTILTINNAQPATDEYARERGNSLRLIDEKQKVKRWFECRDMCLDNPDCELYKYDANQEFCKLYQKEPYKTSTDISLDDCKMFCSKDDKCDYISHSHKNICEMYTRENYNGNTKIGDLWLDFPIYGYNLVEGKRVNTFEECRKKFDGQNVVFYEEQKYCIPKEFTKNTIGYTTVFFNKEPLDKYKIVNHILGLKSENRNDANRYKYIILIFVLIILLFICYKFTKMF
jgi:hypothetical protein